MEEKEILSGLIHKIPTDLKEMILSDLAIIEIWNHLTELARNEWICWILSAKKIETRNKRILQCASQLKEGKKRPCCWPGCSHR